MVSQKILKYATVFSAEFLASAFLLFVGCLGDVDKSPFFVPSLITSSLAWGMTVMVGITTFASVSGGYMTPLITFGAFIHNILDLTTALIYFAAQLTGSFFGYAILRSVIPIDYLSSPQNFCVVQPKLSIGSSFVMEFIVCFIFISFLSSIFDTRNANHQDSTPLKFGFLIIAIHLTAGPLSGGGLNPARVFAPALYNNNWTNQWLYWLAPFSASAASSLLYKHLFAKDYSKKTQENVDHVLDEVNA